MKSDPDIVAEIIAVLEALAKFAWPAIAAVLAWKLYPTLRDVARSRGVKIKVGDLEVSLQDVSENLQRDIADLQKKVSELRAERDKLEAPPNEAIPLPVTTQADRRILWVDDELENNALEIARLKNEEITVTQVTSTAQAIRSLQKAGESFSVVVSDMGRDEGKRYHSRAGLDLVRLIRESGLSTPVLIYTDPSSARQLKREVANAGAQGITGSSLELFEMIHHVLSSAV